MIKKSQAASFRFAADILDRYDGIMAEYAADDTFDPSDFDCTAHELCVGEIAGAIECPTSEAPHLHITVPALRRHAVNLGSSFRSRDDKITIARALVFIIVGK